MSALTPAISSSTGPALDPIEPKAGMSCELSLGDLLLLADSPAFLLCLYNHKEDREEKTPNTFVCLYREFHAYEFYRILEQ